MNRIFTRTVEYNEEFGYYFVEVPDEICEELDLHPGDVMTYDHIDGQIILRKRLEY